MDQAVERVWIMSAYFVPSRRFRKALRRAGRRGVDVRLLLPGPRTDHPWVRQAARRFYAKMLRSGVRIFEYQTSMLHAKMILCDDWVSVGSSNSIAGASLELEANQEIASAAGPSARPSCSPRISGRRGRSTAACGASGHGWIGCGADRRRARSAARQLARP
jgi:hypothetical protein